MKLAIAFLCLLSIAAVARDALTRPTELQYWNASRADNGYNFYGVGGTSYLLDMEGRVVHTWPIGNNPHLLDNGGILDAATNDPSGFSGFKEVSWDGTTVWSHLETRSDYHPHHDFTRIFNPKLNAYTTLYIANKDLTYAQLVAAGADPARTPATGAQMDAIVEVDSSGAIVWEWCFFDHMVQDFDPTKSNHTGSGKTIADYPRRLNINLPGHNLKNDWLHCNSLDYNQALDQIVINSVQGEFYVIDHGNTFVVGDHTASIAMAATSAGDFLYRFGDPVRYNQGTKPSILEDWTQSTTGTKQLGGAHHIHWIPAGVPGAGNFLIFNNGEYLSEHTSQSYVMEINPYVDASGTNTGHYVNPPDAGYNTVTPLAMTDKAPKLISKQVVWNYSSKSNLTLYSNIGCGAQRLPNGNTLICADTYGYVMEVTPTGDTVWDYIMPVTNTGKQLELGDRLPMVNSIFRAFRYKSTHPALAGRTLTAGATAAGRTTVSNPYAGAGDYQALQRPTETQYWDATNAYNGYTFFCARGTSYLIDMQGRVVKTWATGTDARLLGSGNLLDWNSSTPTGLKELDWNGNIVWQQSEARSTYHPHGDFKRIYNPKLGDYSTIFLANKDLTAAECIAAGCDPADAPYDGAQVDTIVEVDMSGNVIWEWSFWNHAVQSIDKTKDNYVTNIANYPGKINLNLPGRPLRANWLDCNSLDYNPSLDRIVVNSRQGELYIIDHGSTFLAGNPTGSIALAASVTGDFLYRFGDPARYGQGNPPSVSDYWQTATSGNKQIGGSSSAQWIGTGLPGAGRLLVFSNNQYLYQRTPQSYVLEINPYLNSSKVDTGAYVDPPTALYDTWTFNKDTMKVNQSMSRQIVWNYASVSNLTMFSHFGSSAQRLPNGNTLICATTEGYFLEVDASGNVVWEYINPVTESGIAAALGDRLPMTNAVPRALRYAASFAGFDGHTLTPGATIVGNQGPVITGTTRTPAVPSASEPVWVTSTITDDGSIASATLTYSTGSGTSTSTPFREIFSNGSTNSGLAGAMNAWTVTATRNAADVRQRGGAVNHTAPIVLTNCTTTSGATTVTCASTTGVSAGMLITGANIAATTTVASVSNATTLVLSANATGSGSSLSLTVAGVTLANCNTSVGSANVTCASTTGLVVGMGVSGPVTNPPNPMIAAITDATHFTLSGNVTNASTNATFTASGCGLEFNNGTPNYTDTMVATTNAINAGGATSGSVEFYVRTADLTSNNGWTFQISPDGGTTWNTRLSESYEGGTVHLTGVTLNSGNNQTTGSTTVTCASTASLAAGMIVQGPSLRLTGCGTTSGSPIVTLANTTGLAVGMFVTGTGIPNIARVTAIVANTSFTMNSNATVTSTSAIHVLANYLATNATVSSVTNATSFVLSSAAFYSSSSLTLDATTVNHGFTLKRYDLATADLTANIMLRFQWSGATAVAPARPPVCDIDDIVVTLNSGAPQVVTLFDDGYHQDGVAGDHVYGAQIPAQPLGTTVSYYLTATDDSGFSAVDPASAPATPHSYTVGGQSGHAPTVASAAAATPNPVTGTTTALSALGADEDTAESTLTYTWVATTLPAGAGSPGFSANGTNAAKNTTATFSKAGTYGFTVTIADPGGLSVTSQITVTVNQTPTALAVSPATASVGIGRTQQFSAVANDQFGNLLASQPTFTWTTTVSGGSVSSSGLFTAPGASASGSVTATSGTISGSATVTVANIPPVITGTTRIPASPSASDAVWVTSTIIDDGGIASANLTYSTGGGSGVTTTVFTETMTATAVKPWTGSGAVNPWTVTGSNYIEQRTGANYSTGNVCGLEYKAGTTLNPLTSAMVTTTNSINATGTSGYVEFWVQTLTLSGTAGWAFQVSANGGTTYTTRLSELTGSSHAWQKYHYDLAAGELVGTLRMRFQFTGGGTGTDHRIDLDQITVVTQAAGGTTPATVSMFDDGAHQDGAANDHVYGAQIPAKASGTTVTYYISATDNDANTVTDPAGAPGTTYSYTVGSGTTTQTVGLFMHDPAKASPGYTLFAPKHNTRTYLIDNYGRVVHAWTTSTNVPGQSVYLRENGNLLRTCMTMGALSSGGGEGGRLEEYDWNDNLVWELDWSTANYMSHHDVAPLPNGNVLMLVVERRTTAEVLAAGFNPSLLDSQITTKGYMLPDTVVEIAPTGASGGTVVWQWKIWDHLVQNFDPTKANYNATPNAHPELVNPNAYTETGRIMQFWNHMNSISYNAAHDQVMLSVRGSSELWVIDHSTTTAEAASHSGGTRGKGGDLLYRWGNPVTYGAGTAANQMYFDQHDTHWIEEGCPGAGNIIAFNNGIGRNYSSIDEFVSPMLADGSYPLTAGSAYAPSALAWTYVATPPASLYSEAISGAQRLPNGNTLVCDGVHGVFTEVTTSGVIVWKYINSEVKDGTTPSEILYQGQEPALDDRGHLYNAVFKIHRYPADYAAFTGRTLTPGAQLELYTSPTIASTAHTPAAPAATDPVWVTATVTDDTSVASVALAYIVNGSSNTVTMLDDGAHQDGAANDHVYGGQIPALPTGTTVRYYLTATDGVGGITKDPVAAPTVVYTYSVSGSGTITGWTMLALPDTGQTGDYTATAGEDSDYAIRVPSFTANGNGTVTDTVTGLMWQQSDGGEMTWENASAYAAALTLGGHSDWRLPFSHELFSILNHGKINPPLDTTVFTVSAAQYWWSADTGADDSTRVWAANAGGGIGPHPRTETLSAGGSKRFHVLCVRDTRPSTVTKLAHNFTVNADGTVTDNHTGLIWQQVPAVATMAWEDALAYAEGLSLGGRTDWRLPNIKELRSICDDGLANPALDTTTFPGTATARYWSSTTQINAATQAWLVEARTGLVAYDNKTAACTVRCVRAGIPAEPAYPELALIPSGQFEMGDHFNLGGAEHASDEIPLHTVAIDAFTLGKTEITNQQYHAFLESALAAGLIEVRNGYVYATGGSEILCETAAAVSYSSIAWSGSRFSVLVGRDNHPMIGLRWLGAAAYCNWLSTANGYTPCYNLTTGVCDFTKSGYRLPTEAEWEYAASGGKYYFIFPWGNDTNTSGTFANWPNSGDPYETGNLPWTTPVGFYNGELHTKADFNWPGALTTYQTTNAINGYGLHDMSGNVWEWCNDWYGRSYYSVSTADNPQGPATGDPMPDGKPYRVLRGGNWFNGEEYFGHGRISNRNPGYYRGPQDPNHPYYHVGFRVARPATSVDAGVTEAGATLATLAGGLGFCEGPAADASGNIYFSNMAANRILTWSTSGVLSTFRENAGGANGLYFYGANMLACEGTNGRVVSISMGGDLTVMADTYAAKRFNQPNDLWIDPEGGVYFSDPVYGSGTVVQGGEHVYYLSADRSTVTRVISDMIRPNGLIGTPDGRTFYVSDHGAGAVWRYTIQPDGSLTGKTLFASVASDGMTIDTEGNIYLTASAVLAYSPGGSLLEEIGVPERPTNVTFGGTDRRSLFITTEAGLYSIRTRVQGNAANFAPVCSGYAATGEADKPMSIYPAKIVERTSDPDGDEVTLIRVFGPSAQGGTVMLTDTVNYTPPAGYVGIDTFEVEVTDTHGASARGTVIITLTAEPGGEGQNQTSFSLHDGKAEMVFRGIPGRSYTVQRSTDLTVWTNLATVIAGADGKIPYIDSSPPVPKAFYRTRTD